MIVGHLDEMLEQADRQCVVMGISLHPYVVGQPFRLRHLRGALGHIMRQRDRMWLTTAGAIAQAWAAIEPRARSQ